VFKHFQYYFSTFHVQVCAQYIISLIRDPKPTHSPVPTQTPFSYFFNHHPNNQQVTPNGRKFSAARMAHFESGFHTVRDASFPLQGWHTSKVAFIQSGTPCTVLLRLHGICQVHWQSFSSILLKNKWATYYVVIIYFIQCSRISRDIIQYSNVIKGLCDYMYSTSTDRVGTVSVRGLWSASLDQKVQGQIFVPVQACFSVVCVWKIQ